MADEDVLKIEVKNRVCRLTLNRPERRNSLNRELTLALGNAILDADHNPDVSVVAITGTGDKAFCAGADLRAAREVDETTGNFRGPLQQVSRATTEIMLDSKKPLIAVMNGPAVAGGCEIALACDLRVVAEHAFFALTEAKRGMGAHYASVVLPQMVPPGIAMEWLYMARRIPVDEAERWGLVNRRAPYDKLWDVANELIEDIVRSAPLSLQRMKLTYRKTLGMPLESALRVDVGPDVYASEDRKEGARAFLEKRDPVWQGR